MGRTPRTDTAGPRGGDPLAPGPAAGPRELSPLHRGAGVLVLVGLAVLAASLAGPWDPPLRNEQTAAPSAPAPTSPPAPTAEPDPLLEALDDMDIQPWDLTWLGVAMLSLIALGIVYLVLRWAKNRPPRPVVEDPDPAGVVPGDLVPGGHPTPDLPELRAGLDDAGQQLRTEQRPADAVIAAWVRLEEAAARSGVVRGPASTPTEFTVAVLDRTPADPTATRVLLGLYLRARFGRERLTPDDVASATATVRTLAAGLAEESEHEQTPPDDHTPPDDQAPPDAPGADR